MVAAFLLPCILAAALAKAHQSLLLKSLLFSTLSFLNFLVPSSFPSILQIWPLDELGPQPPHPRFSRVIVFPSTSTISSMETTPSLLFGLYFSWLSTGSYLQLPTRQSHLAILLAPLRANYIISLPPLAKSVPLYNSLISGNNIILF